MVNNTPNERLDEAVKQVLSNYEAGSEGSDWARMERMLDATPRGSGFKWSYALNGFIALAVITASYFTYTAISHHRNTTPENVQPEVVPAPVVKTTTPPAKPVITTPAITPAASVSSPAITTTAVAPVVTPAATPATTHVANNTAKPVKTESTGIAKTNKKKEGEGKLDPEELKNMRVIGMGNEPVFGDMLDSSKGIIGDTKEKKELREAAKKAGKTPVGWNSFMLSNVDPDSIRSYRERVKKDSSKVE